MAASATKLTAEHASDSNPRRFMSNELRNFLTLSYDELEQLNLNAKEQRRNRVPVHKVQEERLKYLTDEKRIKAVTVDSRLHRAARERFASGDGLALVLLGAF